MRPRNVATNATRDPGETGGGVCHSTDRMLPYQVGAFATVVGKRGNLADRSVDDVGHDVDGHCEPFASGWSCSEYPPAP